MKGLLSISPLVNGVLLMAGCSSVIYTGGEEPAWTGSTQAERGPFPQGAYLCNH
jgi:hypothetical protein